MGGKRIGIDLDNTLISYEEVFRAYACERGLIAPGFCGGKDKVREAIRAGHDGELAWQKLQGTVYSKGIVQAVMFEGTAEFLRRAQALGREIVIVSHKTEFAHHDPEKINLRVAALAWMRDRGFFSDDGFGISLENVRFCATRSEKIASIRESSVDYFIDDLPEVLGHRSFPPEVTGILFTRGVEGGCAYPRALSHWRDIADMVLG
jgi:hypothetical protein